MFSAISPQPKASVFRRARGVALATSVGLSLAFAPLAWADTTPPPLTAQAAALPSFAPLVKKVLPAVVNISVTEKPTAADNGDMEEEDQGGPEQGFPPSPFDQFLRKFFEQQGHGMPGMPMQPNPNEQRIALGSGFIIDPAGYIVTNNHVVADADKVTVIFQDGSKHPAKVLGRDPKTDLALLKIAAKKPLPYVSWGNSNALEVGDWVLAVGNPFGLGGTVSSGIISARGRDIHSGPYDDYLQLDAAINRGNSGGPTFNLQGQVVGINTAIYSPNGGSVGIGFAIPSSLAEPVIAQLREHGKVERGWLGVQIQEVTPAIASNLGLPKAEGALVADVTKYSPAAKAGVKQGDVILAFNGHEVHKVRDLPIIVAQTPVGEHAKVEVYRDGKSETFIVPIGRMPENPQVAQNDQGGGEQGTGEQQATALGLKLAPLTSEMRQRAGVPKGVKGVVVTDVNDNSPLAEVGIEPGDVIEQVNREPVTTPEEAARKLNAARSGKGESVLLLINRHGTNQFLALSTSKGQNG
jgi:serine protease Do